MRQKFSFYQFNLWLILLILSATTIVPLINVFAVAFSSPAASMETGMILWPKEFSFQGFQVLFQQLDFWRPFLNTLYITVFGVMLHTFFCALGGFILAQPDLPFKNIIAAIIIITITVPSQVIMVPLYMVFKDLHLLNKLSSIIFAEMITGYSIILMRGYFERVPRELVETARIDGASSFSIFRHVYIPMTIPGLVTIILFDIIRKYNTFIKPLVLIDDPKKDTLQIALRSVIRGDDATSTSVLITDNVIMAAIVVALVPLFIFYPYIQKFFIKGAFSGSVKG